jgi:16S rRNA (adenine(1408)-N(1))-methyltransferase
VATDANPDALLETAWRAARKPARGGVGNLLFIAEPVDVLAAELPAVAERVTVILPWGSLLTGLVLPEIASLQHVHRLCAPNASLEIVVSYDERRDTGGVNENHVRQLLPVYESVGFRMLSLELISQLDLRAYDTSWAKRLAFGQSREIWRLRVIARKGTE